MFDIKVKVRSVDKAAGRMNVMYFVPSRPDLKPVIRSLKVPVLPNGRLATNAEIRAHLIKAAPWDAWREVDRRVVRKQTDYTRLEDAFIDKEIRIKKDEIAAEVGVVV